MTQTIELLMLIAVALGALSLFMITIFIGITLWRDLREE